MKSLVRICLVAGMIFIAYSGRLAAQEKESSKKHDTHMQHEEHKNSTQHEHGKKASEKDMSIVHKGTIDLKAIDKNKDGKVYQDPMDWNVISDKPGTCPLCKMDLVEVTLKKAKENLVKNGFKVK